MTQSSPHPDLRTRLRELRKSKGWTLAQVADQLGTTAQTVSRLETNVMTVSTDWLQKFANLFGVAAAELIADEPGSGIEVIGQARADGTVMPMAPTPLPLHLRADGCIAVRLDENLGPYRAGSYLVAAKLEGRNLSSAAGHHCIAESDQGVIRIATVIEGIDGQHTLVPLGHGNVQYDQGIKWIARINLEARLID